MHTKTMPDGKLLDVEKLLVVIRRRKPHFRSVDRLHGYSRSKRTGFSKERYERADVKFPVIIDSTGLVLDGRHRLLKAKDAGIIEVPVIVATKEDIRKCLLTKFVNADID